MRKVKLKSYEYIENLIGTESNEKLQARKFSDDLGLGGISLSMVEASWLSFFVSQIQPKKMLEIGTLTGLSALYLLEKASVGAKLWTLEKSPEHAEMAKKSLDSFVKAGQCEIVIGDAVEKLNEVSAHAPFDLIFIDGNKAAYEIYFDWAVKNLSVGGLIIADNVFLSGAVWGDSSQQKFNEKQVSVMKIMNQKAFASENLQSVIMPTEEGMLICKKLF